MSIWHRCTSRAAPGARWRRDALQKTLRLILLSALGLRRLADTILLLIVAPGQWRTACGSDDGVLLPGYRIAVFILMSGRQQSAAGQAGFNNQRTN
jgi:hypothetical protein